LNVEQYPDVTPNGAPRTREFISRRIDTLKLEMDDITQKIDSAKRLARAKGIYCDPEWLTALEASKRRRGTAIQSLQREMAVARKRENQADARVFERLFMNHAKQLLDKETYLEIVARARADKQMEMGVEA
jgi:hypothetical protein